MILKRTSLSPVSGLLLTPLFLAARTLSCGHFSRASEFELRSYDSRLQGAVDRVLGGSAEAIVVVDVESGEILAAKNLEVAGTQLIRPGSTLKPFVVMELLDSGKLDPKQRLICGRPLGIAGMRLDCSHTAVTYGTAPPASVDGMKIAGKTGTASAAHGPPTHGIFIGDAPADRPEIAMVVYVSHGRGPDAVMSPNPFFQEYRRIKQKP